MSDLVSRTTRGLFRDLMTASTVRTIEAAFQDEGFAPNPDCSWEDSSTRRWTTQSYLDTVAWNDPGHVARVLRVFERLLDGYEEQYTRRFWESLRRDGYQRDPDTGQLSPVGPVLSIASLAHLSDPSAIREGFDRLRRAASEDPALAVGTAKELIESTAKVVLVQLGETVEAKDDLPKLARRAQTALGLHPSAVGADGSEGVKRILGALTSIAEGLAQLRNAGYGTGHGPATARVGLRPRHAQLAVNAAVTWCQLMLDTLADPAAPWRQQAAESSTG